MIPYTKMPKIISAAGPSVFKEPSQLIGWITEVAEGLSPTTPALLKYT